MLKKLHVQNLEVTNFIVLTFERIEVKIISYIRSLIMMIGSVNG